jgi:hypothetical protein
MVARMLKAKGGTTIAAVMEATGWQAHTCRGFFAGTWQEEARIRCHEPERRHRHADLPNR